jgi:hypothetical protein
VPLPSNGTFGRVEDSPISGVTFWGEGVTLQRDPSKVRVGMTRGGGSPCHASRFAGYPQGSFCS